MAQKVIEIVGSSNESFAKSGAKPVNDQPAVDNHLPDKVGAHTHGA